jgi:hypothetical protein
MDALSMSEGGPRTAAHRHLVAWAWACVALAPVGLALSVVTLLGLASLLEVDLLPDRGTARVSAPAGLLLGSTSMVVALSAPTLAVVLSVRAARAGQRTARAARAISMVLLALTLSAFTIGVGTFGLFGLVVVGLVLFVALRRRASR